MTTIKHPKLLTDLLNFEQTIRSKKIDLSRKLDVAILYKNSFVINFGNERFYGFASSVILLQIGSRIWKTQNYKIIRKNWENTSGSVLAQLIKNVFEQNSLNILYSNVGASNKIYGVVTDAFVPIHQCEFRESFLESIEKFDFIKETGKVIKNLYGNIIEVFDVNLPFSQTKMSYLLRYGLNNGCSAVKVQFGRIIIVCSNGLTKLENDNEFKLMHYGDPKLQDFIERTINDGVFKQNRLEEKISISQNTKLIPDHANELLRRICLPVASKQRIVNQFKMEERKTGSTEWSLSQALTWLGTHEKALPFRSKDICTEAGTLIAEETLRGMLDKPSSLNTSYDGCYNLLLPN